MSFEIVCPACGALSGPSVGVCPFCKTALIRPKTDAASAAAGNEQHLKNLYLKEGKLQETLSYFREMTKVKPELLQETGLCEIHARVLIESEAPTTGIRSALQRGILVNPEAAVLRTLDRVAAAKSKLRRGREDEGEIELRAVLKDSPNEDLALFLLGAHLFWIEGDAVESVRLLEKAVKLRPSFLRAWGCLGSIYLKLGNGPLASRAFQRCVKLEENPEMKKFFQSKMAEIG